MAIAESDIPLIKPWLVKRSGQLSDAEPEVLADYIIALLNNQVTGEELIKLVASQIEDFLDDSEKFAAEIEETLRTRSFDTSDENTKKKLLDPEETKKRTQKAAIELSTQFYKNDVTTYRGSSKKKFQRLPTNGFPGAESANGNASSSFDKGGKEKQRNNLETIIAHHEVHEGTKLIVANLPVDKLQEPIIRAYFQRFGDLKSVTVDHVGRFAELEFEQAKDAKKAWISPNPIFDNRFIKVFFKKAQRKEEEPPFDVEKFKAEQEERQQKWEAKQEQKKIYDAKLKQLIEIKERMLSNFEKELTKLEEQLKADPSLEAEVSQKVEHIQKQMEANGVTPELIAQDRAKLEGKPVHSLRGGRGRGSLRGRGRGGRVAFPYARPQKKLDLRTRAILIKNFGDIEDPQFKKLLQNVGEDELNEVAKTGDNEIRLIFKERHLAELFFRDETKLTENGEVFVKEWDESIRPEVKSTGTDASSETETLTTTVDQDNDVEM